MRTLSPNKRRSSGIRLPIFGKSHGRAKQDAALKLNQIPGQEFTMRKWQEMFTYRKTTKQEDEVFGNRCCMILNNQMQCPRRVTRMVNGKLLCEGHFQPQLAMAVADAEVIINLDEPREEATGESEPTEKPKIEA